MKSDDRASQASPDSHADRWTPRHRGMATAEGRLECRGNPACPVQGPPYNPVLMVPRFVVGLSAVLVAALLAQKSRHEERPGTTPSQCAETGARGQGDSAAQGDGKPAAPKPDAPKSGAGPVLRVDTDRPPVLPAAVAAPRLGLPLPRESLAAVPPDPPQRRSAAHFQTCDLAHAPPRRADA